MKKKKILIELFILLFIMSLFLSIYVLLEMRGDFWAVLGAAAVQLIAAYLLIDSLLDINKKEPEKAPLADTGLANGTEELMSRLVELQDIQKAVYTVTKRYNLETAELLRAMEAHLAELRDETERLNQSVTASFGGSNTEHRILQIEQNILEQMKAYRQDQQSGVKMIIKYNKENAHQLAENSHNNTEMLLSELHDMFEQMEESLNASMTVMFEQSEQNAGMSAMMASPIHEAAAAYEPVSTEMKGPEPEAVEPEAAESEVYETVSTEMEVPEPEAVEPEAVESEVYETVSTEMEVPEPEAADSEVYETVSTEMEVPEPEAVESEVYETASTEMEVPEPVMSEALQNLISDDPNKALTPEEIAAMFAAAGQ